MVRSKAIILLLLCSIVVGSLFIDTFSWCGAIFVVQYFFVILGLFEFILMGKRKYVALLYCLSNVLWLLAFCGLPHSTVGWSAVCDCDIS